MRFAFQYVPFRFAVTSCAVYLLLIGVLAGVGMLVASRGWAISGPRWFWLTLNAVFFLAASAVAWRVLYPRHLG